MKSLLLLVLIFFCINLNAQIIRDTTLVDTSAFRSIKLNLDKYNKVRQRAWTLSVTSALCGAVALATMESKPDVANIMVDISAVLGIVSFFTFNHADKYIRNISLELSPGKLRITF